MLPIFAVTAVSVGTIVNYYDEFAVNTVSVVPERSMERMFTLLS